MKNSVLLSLLIVLLSTSCTDQKFQTYTANVPVYLSYENLRSSFELKDAKLLHEPGKFVFKDEYMYINEYQEGIHVVDLSDPSNPQAIAFMEIPGNVDIAIRNHVLYADSYVDLVMVNISDPGNPELLGRAEDLFEYIIPPYDYDYPLAEIDRDKGVITDFEIKKYTQQIHYHPSPWPVYYEYDMLSWKSNGSGISGNGENSYGIGGSMARFICYDDYLYALESTYLLKSILIRDIENPEVSSEKYLGGSVETVFIAGTHMYIGTSTGMHILSLEHPEEPVLLSTYQHVTACDPVVVSGNRAYVTLRAGNFCGGEENLLEVIDINDKYDPKRIASHSMTEPYGLGIDGTKLFVCEGKHGLKVFDATDPQQIPARILAEFTGIQAFDVIPLNPLLFAIGAEGFYIYDYSDLNNISHIGTLPVASEED